MEREERSEGSTHIIAGRASFFQDRMTNVMESHFRVRTIQKCQSFATGIMQGERRMRREERGERREERAFSWLEM